MTDAAIKEKMIYVFVRNPVSEEIQFENSRVARGQLRAAVIGGEQFRASE